MNLHQSKNDAVLKALNKSAHHQSILKFIHATSHPSLTVGSHSDEGGGGEEEDEDHVAAKQEPSQCGQVVEPGGCVSVQRLVEERLEVGLTPKRPNCPQTLEWDDEVGEDGAASCRRGDIIVMLMWQHRCWL